MLKGVEFPGVVMVTGAGGSGIGSAVAHAFARAGCNKIVVTDVDASTLASTVASLKNCTALPLDICAAAGDISSEAFVSEFFEKIRAYFGRIDYAVNCAGVIGDDLPSDLSSIEAFDRTNAVNYRGLWMCVREELRMMKTQEVSQRDGLGETRGQRGSIVNIASQLGIVGRVNAPIYCASKSAVIALTRCDAIDASPYRIRVNAVCPGIIDTPMMRPAKEALEGPVPTLADADPAGNAAGAKTMDLSKSIAVAPMNRLGSADEVADVVLFLSHEKASFVQGAAWVVDGGYTIN